MPEDGTENESFGIDVGCSNTIESLEEYTICRPVTRSGILSHSPGPGPAFGTFAGGADPDAGEGADL